MVQYLTSWSVCMVIVDQIIFVCGFHLEQIHSSSSSTETIRSSPVSHLLNNIPQTLDFEFSLFFLSAVVLHLRFWENNSICHSSESSRARLCFLGDSWGSWLIGKTKFITWYGKTVLISYPILRGVGDVWLVVDSLVDVWETVVDIRVVDVVGVDEASIVVGWVGTFVTSYRSDVASVGASSVAAYTSNDVSFFSRIISFHIRKQNTKWYRLPK